MQDLLQKKCKFSFWLQLSVGARLPTHRASRNGLSKHPAPTKKAPRRVPPCLSRVDGGGHRPPPIRRAKSATCAEAASRLPTHRASRSGLSKHPAPTKKAPRRVPFLLAERVGFEPTAPCGVTGFQDQLLKPLGHLSVPGAIPYYITISGAKSQGGAAILRRAHCTREPFGVPPRKKGRCRSISLFAVHLK